MVNYIEASEDIDTGNKDLLKFLSYLEKFSDNTSLEYIQMYHPNKRYPHPPNILNRHTLLYFVVDT